MLDPATKEFRFPFENALLSYQNAKESGEAGSAELEHVANQECFSLFLKYPKEFITKLAHVTLFSGPSFKV